MVGLLAFVTSWRFSGLALAWGWVGRPCLSGALEAGAVSPGGPGPGCEGRVPRRERKRRAAEGWAGKAEKGQARHGYFNLINDHTPLRVCFNNQDTLQQVDRMFAVNLHMSSEQAVSVNSAWTQAPCRRLSPSPRVAPLSPGGCFSRPPGVWGQQPREDRSEGHFGYFLSGESSGPPTKIRVWSGLLRQTTAGVT